MLLLLRFLGLRRVLALVVARRIWRMVQERRAANQPR
jgi:hypothetical protein